MKNMQVSALPLIVKPEDPFYIALRTISHTPLKEADSISQRVGQIKLSNLVKVMSQKAGFEKKINKSLGS